MPTGTRRLDFVRLAEKLAPGGRLLRAWQLKGGLSAGMTALELALPGGDRHRLVLRQAAPGLREMARLLGWLRARGMPVPAPVYFGPDGQRAYGAALALAYIEGSPQFAPSRPRDYACKLADQLAALHALPPAAELNFLPYPYPPGLRPFERPPENWDESLGEGRIRARLVRAAARVCPTAPALLHGDYWPGNLLWQGDQLVGVIDWEDAALGDPLADLAIARLDLAWIIGPEAMHAFTARYLQLRPLDTAGLPYWDLCAALRLVRLAGPDLPAWAAYFAPCGRSDITPHTIRRTLLSFIDQACAALDH